MSTNRRDFLRLAGAAGLAVVAGGESARASHGPAVSDDLMGVLVDIPKCIGCRRCEYACQEAAGFDPLPVETFEDKSVFEQARRPYPRSHTVSNRYANPKDETQPTYNKFNCMHCIDPACVSACLVSAISKLPDGPVVYDKSRCMGCRYCLVSCPFEIPTYDYDMPLTPQVRKCNMCAHLVPDKQSVPACVKICPQEVLTYGKRSDLLELAHDKIRQQPDVYVDGFKHFGTEAPPRLTEKIQHAEFKYFIPPLMWYGLLGAAMWLSQPEGKDHAASEDD